MSEKSANLAKLQKQAASQSSVLTTLLVFCVALAVLPIGSYFLTFWYVFDGNSIYSAIIAVVAANVVLIGYIILSIRDDVDSRKEEQTRKQR